MNSMSRIQNYKDQNSFEVKRKEYVLNIWIGEIKGLGMHKLFLDNPLVLEWWVWQWRNRMDFLVNYNNVYHYSCCIGTLPPAKDPLDARTCGVWRTKWDWKYLLKSQESFETTVRNLILLWKFIARGNTTNFKTKSESQNLS